MAYISAYALIIETMISMETCVTEIGIKDRVKWRYLTDSVGFFPLYALLAHKSS